MVSALLSSLLALFWCCVLLAFIMMLFSLVFVQLIEDYLSENIQNGCVGNTDPVLGDGCLNDHLMYHFGSVQKAVLSLYMATSGGNDWSLYYNLMWRVDPMTAGVFLFYTAFYFFGIFNLLTGMFVDKAVRHGQGVDGHPSWQQHWRWCSSSATASSSRAQAPEASYTQVT
jgi:hypothetical protein